MGRAPRNKAFRNATSWSRRLTSATLADCPRRAESPHEARQQAEDGKNQAEANTKAEEETNTEAEERKRLSQDKARA